ncbi:ABC transporter ATP-binding protein [Sphingomonas daechungensis]|uniref:ABC transporter ATP-binding protein n=1 Tax=Sphingomonas daechungensis TaxID=1176646 RepID=UPI001A5E6E9D|nr:ATP-binding cassette domain-containing protein [Rhodospirillales bacterium]
MGLLEVRNLSVEFQTGGGRFKAVDGVDLDIDAGEVLGIVGESGSGKSVSMLAVMGLIAWPGRVQADVMRFDGLDLLTMAPKERRKLMGRDIAMIFQEPMTSLNPCFTVGFQIAEALKVHEGGTKESRHRRSIELLAQVGIPAPETRLSAFPHQLSGGMSQRVMIAMAIACNPRLLIADEPTTALDVTIQAQILDLLAGLQRSRGMAMVLITHDMGVVAETAHRIQVMYSGVAVEERSTGRLFAAPRHPYTAALLDALPERAVHSGAPGKARLPTIPGMVPGIADRPDGCLFNPRCGFVAADCVQAAPSLVPDNGGRVRCHHPIGRDGA